VASIYGPHICGDAIDFKSDGHTIITGSYRDKDVIQIWDIRTNEAINSIAWDGLENTRPQPTNGPRAAPFVYSCIFNNSTNLIMAGGAGANEVRIFDFNTGSLVSAIKNLPKAVLCMSLAHNNNDFVFGSVDSKSRVITQKNVY
jgi:WD40 repeat protein